jgi:hypothetical protein
MGVRTWTDAELQALRAAWDRGDSLSKIGRQLRKSVNAIAGAARRLDLPPRRPQAHRVTRASPSAEPAPTFDPKRADKVLRRFSWETAR